MRILNVNFLLCLFLVLTISSTPLLGNDLKTNFEKLNLLDSPVILPDTTCGLTDTIFQIDLLSCEGAMDASAKIELEGVTGPLFFAWDNGNSTATATGLSAGKHYVSVTDFNGCTLIDSIEIAATTSTVSLEVSGIPSTCFGIDDGIISVNDTLMLEGYTYLWNTGDTTSSISNLSPDTYTVIVTNAEGCTKSENIQLGVIRSLVLDIDITNASCIGVNNGAIIVNDSSDVTGFQFGWSTGDSTQMVNDLSAGSYTVAVADAAGCIAAASVVVPNEANLEITTTAIDASCEGVEDGSVAVNNPEGLNFLWNTGDTTQTVANIAAGTYSVIVTDSAGCTAVDTTNVANGAGLTIDISQTDATCDGLDNGSITINDSIGIDGLTLDWSTGDSTQSISGLASGQYTILATDSLGCSVNQAVIIEAGPSPNLEITSINESCNGVNDGSISVNDTLDNTGLSFTWNTGDSTSNISGLTTGSYMISVTDTIGCISTETVTIAANSNVVINLSKTDATCFGVNDGSITVNDTLDISGLSFNWSTGDSTQTISGLNPGNYIVTVTDSTGCSATDSIIIGELNTIEIGLTGNNISCMGAMDGLVAASIIGVNSDNVTFLWDTGDSTASIMNLAPGEYTVTVTDTMGCSGIGGVNLVDGDSINISFVVSDIACMDTTGTGGILAVASGGAGGFTYSWNTGETNSSINNLTAGTYILEVTDSVGCTFSDSISLANPPDLIVSASMTTAATCDGTSDGSATVAVSGGTSPYQIRWSNGLIIPTIDNLNPGIYTVNVTDEAGCEIMDTVTIEQSTQLILSLTEINPASSETATDGQASVSVTGGLAPYSFDWDTGSNMDTVSNLSAGFHSLTVTDANNCFTSDSLSINFDNLNVTIGETRDVRCNGASTGRATALPSDGVGPYTYAWNNGDTLAVLTNLPAGDYRVTVTDSEGNRGTASTTLSQPLPIYFNLEIIPPGCPTSANGRITINAQNAVGNLLYDIGVGLTPDPVIFGISPGRKTYSIIDGNNCVADTTFFLETLSPAIPDAGFTVQGLGTFITFQDTSNNNPTAYLWEFGDSTFSNVPSPVHNYADTGSYEVCLSISNSCGLDKECRTILVEEIPVPGVELNFGGDTSSLSGQLIQIPVTVSGFTNLAAINGTFRITNDSVGTIQAVRELNLPGLIIEDIGIQPDLISIDWAIEDSNYVSIPAGTQIFVIDFLLTGSSDQCAEIRPGFSDTGVSFTKSFEGAEVPAPFIINSGEFCVAPTVSLAGNISREEDVAIGGVTVTTNEGSTFTTQTDGNYSIGGLPGGATFEITANKENDILLGVTTFDIVRILQHILTKQPLESPYKIIAADINNSGSVTSLDLVQLQRLLLDQISAFPNNAPWRFVPENYAFNNPNNPLAEDFPETLLVEKLELDTANLDFVAIKVGDVVGESTGNGRYLPKSMGFEIEEQKFKAGDVITIPFQIKEQSKALGFQFELGFNTDKLTFVGAKKDSYLPINTTNLGIKNIADGRLKLLWINHQQLPIRDLTNGLFQLEFIAQQDGTLSQSLKFLKESFPAQLYSEQSTEIGFQDLNLIINNAKITSEEPVLTTETPALAFFNAGENDNAAEGCSDGLDNDNDGLIDCADADCFCECNTVEPSENLIINAGAEQPLSSGGWQLVEGTWTTRGANPDPQDGAAYFYPLNSELGQLTQEVDLSADSMAIANGEVTYFFSGFVRSFDQVPSDETQIIVEYKNTVDSVLKRYDTGLITSLNAWQLITDTTLAPLNTAKVAVNLIARRKNGSNNDAYFDNLSLTKSIDDTCIDPCENVEIFTLTTDAIINSDGGTANATLVGGTGPSTFLWSNGATTADLTELTPGTYSVEANDSIGCTVTDTFLIQADSSFFVALNTAEPICDGDTNGAIFAEVTGGTAPYMFNWSDSLLMGDTLMNLAGGMYALTVTDADGLTALASVSLSTGAIINLNQDSSKIVNESCPNIGDGRFSLVAEGGTAPYSFVIDNDTTDNGVFTNLNADTHLVFITDVLGCQTSHTIVLQTEFAGTASAAFSFATDALNVTFNSAVASDEGSTSWTFGNDSTSTENNPVITYSQAGVYEVCLTVTNDCGNETTCQNITVGVTGPVTFVVNDINGVANDTVYVPITVENFIGITSYQKTIQVQDTSIARIVGISDVNLTSMTADNFFQANDFTLTNVWFDASGLGQSVSNNEVLYNLMLMIDSDVDTCVGINIADSPVPTQVSANVLGEVVDVPFNIVNGEVCTNASAQITGNIARETGVAVSGVLVGVSDFSITPTSNGDGDYLIEKLPIGGSFEVTPSLNTPLLQSVSTFDIVLINRHILGNRLFDSPYKHIAADVNKNGSISVFDLILIQRAILGLNGEFMGNNAWRFIPKSYEFNNPNDPLMEAFPESIMVSDINGNVDNQDFVAIKIADVSYNTPDTDGFVAVSEPRTNNLLTLKTGNQQFTAGKNIVVPINTKEIGQFSGFQLEIDFDPNSLVFDGIEAADLPNFDANNIGVKYLSQGKIQLSWVAPNMELSTDISTLFNLKFTSKVDGQLNNLLQLSNRYLASESYTDDLMIGKVQLTFEETEAVIPQIMTVFPNPTTGQFEVIFDNSNKEKVQLSVYNFTGQLITQLKDLDTERINLNLAEQSDGTYIIVLNRPEGIEVQRVILSR